MARDTHIYGKVENKTDLKEVFQAIRRDVDEAKSRPGLTELYKRAGYLIALTHAPSWETKFGSEAKTLKSMAHPNLRNENSAISSRSPGRTSRRRCRSSA